MFHQSECQVFSHNSIFSVQYISHQAVRKGSCLLQENYSDVMSSRSQAAQLAPALSTIYQNVQAGYDLTRLPGLGLFYSEQNDERHCPTVLAKFVRRLNALPQLSVIVTVRNVGLSLFCAHQSCSSVTFLTSPFATWLLMLDHINVLMSANGTRRVHVLDKACWHTLAGLMESLRRYSMTCKTWYMTVM